MLTNTQRAMIQERKAGVKDVERKKYIDFTLRKYIKKQLDSINDIDEAFSALPAEQKKRLLETVSDEAVFTLIKTAIEIMRAKNFRMVVGDLENPDGWEALTYKDANKPQFEKVTKTDIMRSSKLGPIVRDLTGLMNLSDDPVIQTVVFQEAKNDRSTRAVLDASPQIAEKYRRAEERISDASL